MRRGALLILCWSFLAICAFSQGKPSGSHSYITFDGKNVWVAFPSCGKIMRFRAIDRYSFGSVSPINYGGGLTGIAFDGTNIWAMSGDHSTRVRPSDGERLPGFYYLKMFPREFLFDGENVWVTWAYSNEGGVEKFRGSDKGTANLGSYYIGYDARGLAFDGEHIWVAWGGSVKPSVTKLRASDGKNLGSFEVPKNPAYVAYDGANIWVGNPTEKSVTKLRPSDGAKLGTFALASGDSLDRLTVDGKDVWILSGKTLIKLSGANGTELGRYKLDRWGMDIAFDGENIWLAVQDGNWRGVTVRRASDGACVGPSCTSVIICAPKPDPIDEDH